MAWVKAEYAPELAVLSTWISMLLPWSVAYHAKGPLGSVLVFVRFSVFELQLRFPSQITFEGVPLDVAQALNQVYSGVQIGGNVYVALPPTAALDYGGSLALANGIWTVAALLLLIAFVLSLAVYTDESRAERLPYPYPRLAGALLGGSTVVLALAAVLMAIERGTVGFPIPVGVLVMGALSFVLLRVDIVADGGPASE